MLAYRQVQNPSSAAASSQISTQNIAPRIHGASTSNWATTPTKTRASLWKWIATNDDSEFEEESESEGNREDDPEEDVPILMTHGTRLPTLPLLAAVGAVSGPSTTVSIAAAMTAGIAAAASAIGLGVGLGTTHTLASPS